MFHADQLCKKLGEPRAFAHSRDAAQEGLHLRVALRREAFVAELHHLCATPALQSKAALQPVGFAVVRECDIDFASLFPGAQEVGRDFEIFLENRVREKQRVAETFDQRAFAVAVSSGDAVDAGLEGHRDPLPLRALAVGLDVLQANRADDHTASTESGVARAIRTLSTSALARIVSASSCGELPRCTPSFRL